jgi:hypothetical protein
LPAAACLQPTTNGTGYELATIFTVVLRAYDGLRAMNAQRIAEVGEFRR